MKIKIFDKIHWQTVPEVEGMVDINITEAELMQIGITKCFNLETYTIEDFINPQTEYDNLTKWFKEDYTHYEQKYTRLIALQKLCDDGSDPNTKLLELYEEAETIRKRIQELELEINNLNNGGKND